MKPKQNYIGQKDQVHSRCQAGNNTGKDDSDDDTYLRKLLKQTPAYL